MIKVAFRVDASAQVGTGHVTRCLTLANNLRSTGAECYFICRKDQDDLYKKVEGYKFAVYSLPIINKKYKHKIGDSIHASWLGCDWQVDASQTKEHLKHILPDWLVVDHYAIDYRWEIELKQYYKKLMVIDDLADRQHNCDLLLDQNLFLNSTKRYKGLIPDGCIQLLGPQYALLQPEYAKLRSGVYPRNEPHNNLLVFFGGVDQYNLTGMTISALERINIPFKFVNIVISRQSPYYFRLKNQISQFPKVSVYSDLPSLAPLMIKADLAVGAGGATNWERLCLGLPSLVVTVAENQRPVSSDLHDMGLIEWIGDVETIKIDQISTSITDTLLRDDISNWSERCMEACSGQGVYSVVDMMTEV